MTPLALVLPGVLPATGMATVPQDDQVSPGFAGFVAVFALALVTVLLVRSMVGHLRKVRYGPAPDGADPRPGAPANPPADQRDGDRSPPP